MFWSSLQVGIVASLRRVGRRTRRLAVGTATAVARRAGACGGLATKDFCYSTCSGLLFVGMSIPNAERFPHGCLTKRDRFLPTLL